MNSEPMAGRLITWKFVCKLLLLLVWANIVYKYILFKSHLKDNDTSNTDGVYPYFNLENPLEKDRKRITLTLDIINESKPIQAEVKDTSKLDPIEPDSMEPRLKRILYWTAFWDHDDYYFGFGRDPFKNNNCRINTCETTKDLSLLNSSDAVLIHINDIFNVSMMPSYHLPHQSWVYLNMEPPHTTRVDLKPFNGLFNLSISYRPDSSFPNPYGKLRELTEEEKVGPATSDNHINYSAQKKHMAAWFVSDCNCPSSRGWFVQQLQKYIPVHVYGACGNMTCTDAIKCDDMLDEDYKFYLAFENSLCKHYVTEKVWRAIGKHVIPVVLGGADYQSILPPHSYINVKDFLSAKDLADYMLKVSSDDVLYNGYFDWKKRYTHIWPFSIDHVMCDLCAYLHEHQGQIKVIDDLEGWYGASRNCKDPKGYFHDFLGINKI